MVPAGGWHRIAGEGDGACGRPVGQSAGRPAGRSAGLSYYLIYDIIVDCAYNAGVNTDEFCAMWVGNQPPSQAIASDQFKLGLLDHYYH